MEEIPEIRHLTFRKGIRWKGSIKGKALGPGGFCVCPKRGKKGFRTRGETPVQGRSAPNARYS